MASEGNVSKKKQRESKKSEKFAKPDRTSSKTVPVPPVVPQTPENNTKSSIASGTGSGKKELSAGLLNMKFMQRQQERELRAKLEEEQRRAIDEAHWTVEFGEGAHIEKPAFLVEYTQSYLPFANADVAFGRRSYQEFNSSIEKLRVEENQRKQLAREAAVEAENSVTAEEMTLRMMAQGNKKIPGKRKGEEGIALPVGKQAKTEVRVLEGQGTADRFRFLKPAE